MFKQRTHRENSCNLWVRQEGKCFENYFFFLFRSRHRVYFGQERVTHNGFKWQNYAREMNSLTLLELKMCLGKYLPPLLQPKRYPSVWGFICLNLFLLRIYPQSRLFSFLNLFFSSTPLAFKVL